MLVVETVKVAAPEVVGVTETDGKLLSAGPEGDILAVRATVPLKLLTELAVTE